MINEDIVVRVADSYSCDVNACRAFLQRIGDRIFVNERVIALYFKVDDETLEMIHYGLFDLED